MSGITNMESEPLPGGPLPPLPFAERLAAEGITVKPLENLFGVKCMGDEEWKTIVAIGRHQDASIVNDVLLRQMEAATENLELDDQELGLLDKLAPGFATAAGKRGRQETLPPPPPKKRPKQQHGGTSVIGALSGFSLPCAICFMKWLIEILKKRRNNLLMMKRSSQLAILAALNNLVDPRSFSSPVGELMNEKISYYSNKDFYFLMGDFYLELKKIDSPTAAAAAEKVIKLLGNLGGEGESGLKRFPPNTSPAEKRKRVALEGVFSIPEGEGEGEGMNIFEKIEEGDLKTTPRTFKDVFDSISEIVQAVWEATPNAGNTDEIGQTHARLRHELLSIVVPFIIKHNPQYNPENNLVSFSGGQDIINEIRNKLSNIVASVETSKLCKALENVQYVNILTTVSAWAAGAYGLAYSGSSFLTSATQLEGWATARAAGTIALISIFAVASIGNTTSNNFQKEAFYSLKPLIDIARIDKNENIRAFATYISTSAGYLSFHNWLTSTTQNGSPVPASSRGTTGADAAQRSSGVWGEAGIPGAAEAAVAAAEAAEAPGGGDSIEEKRLRVAAALDFLNAQREEGGGGGGGGGKRRLVDVKEFARPSGSTTAAAETNWMTNSAYFPEGGINTRENAASVTYSPPPGAPKSRGKFAGYKNLNDFLDTLTKNGVRSSNVVALDQFIENIYTVATKEGLEDAGAFVPAAAPAATGATPAATGATPAATGATPAATGATPAATAPVGRPKRPTAQQTASGGKARKTRKLKGGRRNKYSEPKKCYTYCAQSVGKRRTRKRKKCSPKKSKKGYCYQRVSKDGYKYCYWNKGGPKGKCKTKKAKKVYYYNRV